jgi:glycosyltransferase involved in cell wall biosynthesis
VFSPCVVIPTFNNPRTLRTVVSRARQYLPDVIVVDDASDPEALAVAKSLEDDGLAIVHRRARNGGKGAAVKDGLRVASARGFSHALQVDADGQHDLDAMPQFIDAARESPDALVLGYPLFDASAPALRRKARLITTFFAHIASGGKAIVDPMCGFRVYPVASALAVDARGDAMDFDIEIAVRMVWLGVRVINLPTRVRYVPASEGGVSHFRMFRDNVLISWVHTRLVTLRILAALGLVTRRRLP